MNAAQAIRRLEEAGFSHRQATGVIEVVPGEVIERLATRDCVGDQTALVRRGSEQIGSVRQELARQIGETRTELMRAINRLTFWMNGFFAALLVAVLGLSGILIGKL